MGFTPRRKELAAPALGVKRIHCIGDSIMHGAGITIEESLPIQLEQALHQEFPEELITCINFGRDGWNIWNSIFHHQALYPEGGCDFLILSLCNNDCEYLGIYGLDYGPDKMIYWENNFLQYLVEKGLAAFRDYTERNGIPALIIYYEPYQESFARVGIILGKLCAKHRIPYLNITQVMHDTYNLPSASLVVSAADQHHPSALFNQLATRLISSEIRRRHTFQSSFQASVLDRLISAAQFMLDEGCDPQTVFAWASRTAKIKTICLPRQITESAERHKLRERLTEVTKLIQDSWNGWQKALWHEGSLRNVQFFMQQELQLFYDAQNHLIPLQETVCLAIACIKEGQLSALEDHTRLFFKTNNMAEAFQLQEQLQNVRNNLALINPIFDPQKIQESQLNWARPNGLNADYPYYLKNWAETVASFLKTIARDFELLSKSQEKDKALASGYLGYLAELVTKALDPINTISEKVLARINHLNTPSPLIGIDAFITVHAKNPGSKLIFGNAVAAKLTSLIPVTINTYLTTQLVDNTVAMRTYHIQLPLFVRGRLEFFMRWNYLAESQLEQFGFSITKIVLRPAFMDANIKTHDIINIDLQDQNLSNFYLEDFWLNV